MTHSTNDRPASGHSTARAAGRRRLIAGVAIGGLAGALLTGTMAAWSHSQGGPGSHGGGRWCKAAASPEGQRARIVFATDWMLDQVQATDSQRAQVKKIVEDAYGDLVPLRHQHRQHREAFLVAIQQPSIDRATLEGLRQAELQLAETASNRIVTALADVAEVLNPEQRVALVKLAEAFRR